MAFDRRSSSLRDSNRGSGRTLGAEKEPIEFKRAENRLFGNIGVAAARVALQSPVQTDADLPKVPDEFLRRDARKVASRKWGDDDESKPDFEFPTFDISPLMIGADALHDSAAPTRQLIQDIGRACEKWGFCQVVNHGMSETLLNRVLEVSNGFFQLPPEEKQVYSVKDGKIQEGYGRMDYLLGDVRFWMDVLRHHGQQKRALEEHQMPHKPAAYRPVVTEYSEGLEKVFGAVERALSVYLGLGQDTLKEAQGDDPHVLHRANFYPKSAEPEKVLGVGAHKDFGSLSVVLLDDGGGFQMQPPGSTKWLDVKPKKGSLLIQIANQVEILSNGRFHSPKHRVLVNRNSTRISVATVLTPGLECVVRPMHELLEKTNQAPRYRQFLYKTYIPNFQKDIFAGKHPHARYRTNQT